MKVSRRYWVTMTWVKTNMQFISQTPVGPTLIREKFTEKSPFCIDDYAHNSQHKTGRIFLYTEADEDDNDEDPWSQEDLHASATPMMSTPHSGSICAVRLRYSGI